jgi:hypothetical protein
MGLNLPKSIIVDAEWNGVVGKRTATKPFPYRLGGAMLLDLRGPALRLLTDVADSFFVISGSGRRWSSGDR